MLIFKLMIVFDVLHFIDSISSGAVAVNDLTHPRKPFMTSPLPLSTLPIVFLDQRMTLIICKQHAAIECLSQS